METGSSRIVVAPRAGGGWLLRETPSGPVLGGAGTKREAEVRATIMLERAHGGRVELVRADGSVERTVTVAPAPPRPGWYRPPGLTRWIIVVLAGSQLLARLLGWRGSVFDVLLLCGSTVLLVVGVLLWWRSAVYDRAHDPAVDS